MTAKKTSKPTQKMFIEKDEPEELGVEALENEKKKQSKVGSSSYNILDLPSKGKLGYPASVDYRDILVKDEEILSLATVDTYSRTLNRVLKGILNDCDFYEDMSIHDRDFALVWVWANNYTAKKEVSFECSHCGHKEPKVVDLTKLEIIDIKDNLPIPFTMPLSRASLEQIDIHLLTVGDEIMVEEYMMKNPKANDELLRLVTSIHLPFNMGLEQKLKWVRENMTSKELGHVRNFHRYFKFGVKDRVDHVCSACGEVTQGALPFQAQDVLFPTVQSDFEELLRASEDS